MYYLCSTQLLISLLIFYLMVAHNTSSAEFFNTIEFDPLRSQSEPNFLQSFIGFIPLRCSTFTLYYHGLVGGEVFWLQVFFSVYDWHIWWCLYTILLTWMFGTIYLSLRRKFQSSFWGTRLGTEKKSKCGASFSWWMSGWWDDTTIII